MVKHSLCSFFVAHTVCGILVEAHVVFIKCTAYLFNYYENRTKVHNDMKEEKKIHKWNTKINDNH